jgi:hypothetical protein
MATSKPCLLDEFAQMGLDPHVRQHAAENYLAYAAFAQLEDQVIGLRAE